MALLGVVWAIKVLRVGNSCMVLLRCGLDLVVQSFVSTTSLDLVQAFSVVCVCRTSLPLVLSVVRGSDCDIDCSMLTVGNCLCLVTVWLSIIRLLSMLCRTLVIGLLTLDLVISMSKTVATLFLFLGFGFECLVSVTTTREAEGGNL